MQPTGAIWPIGASHLIRLASNKIANQLLSIKHGDNLGIYRTSLACKKSAGCALHNLCVKLRLWRTVMAMVGFQCDCGGKHWGLHGAAGLLLVRDKTILTATPSTMGAQW